MPLISGSSGTTLGNVGSVTGTPSAGQVVVATSGTAASWQDPIGKQYDYVQITSNVVVSGSSVAQTTVITGTSVTYDGATRIKVEFYAPILEAGAAAAASLTIELWDGGTDLCELCGVTTPAAAIMDTLGYGCVFITPSSGAHQYIVKGYRSNANGTVVAGTGASAGFAPAFLRITKA